MNTHRVNVFNRTDDNRVVGGIAHQLELVFLPAQNRLLEQHLARGAFVNTVFDHSTQFRLVMGEAGPESPHRERRADNDRIARHRDEVECAVNRLHDDAPRNIRTALKDQILENLAVFTASNGLELCANEFDVVLCENSLLVQGHCRIQRSLTSERGKDCIRLFFHDDRFKRRSCDRFDIRRIGKIRIGHNGRGIRVDQNHSNAFGSKNTARLGSGIVEFGCLTDHNRARPDHEDGIDVMAFRHYSALRLASTSSRNWSNK